MRAKLLGPPLSDGESLSSLSSLSPATPDPDASSESEEEWSDVFGSDWDSLDDLFDTSEASDDQSQSDHTLDTDLGSGKWRMEFGGLG